MATEPYEAVDFDLDAVQRPKNEGNERPFRARLGDRTVVFTDPAELAWQDQLEIDNPVMFLRFCVTDDDRDYIRDLRIEGWKFNQLIERFLRHYKIDLQALRSKAGRGL